MASIPQSYGISRIDQDEKRNHGYYVRVTNKGKTTQKFFPDKALGGKTKSLVAAKAFRDKAVARLPKARREAIAKRRRRIERSGMVGVTHVLSKSTSGKVYEYWQAAWVERGKRKTAKFSIERYGAKKALEMAKRAKARHP